MSKTLETYQENICSKCTTELLLIKPTNRTITMKYKYNLSITRADVDILGMTEIERYKLSIDTVTNS